MSEKIHTARYHVGVDLGQRRDFTAIVVIQDQLLMTGRRCPRTFAPVLLRRRQVLLAKRVGLGTEYQKIVDTVGQLTRLRQMAHGDKYVAVDTTGVGLAVLEMLRRENLAGQLLPVVFTGGEVTRYAGGQYNVPKGELMHGLAVELERRELQVGRLLRNWPEMVRELSGMRRDLAGGGVRWRSVGEHDDLVMALALAVWSLRRVSLPSGKELEVRPERLPLF
jgi:hypothetical protein